MDAGESTPYFFVQVKTTRKDFTKRQTPPRLVIGVTEADIRRMVAFPAPTYVVGVHEDDERAFVVSVHEGMNESLFSITTGHELTCNTLERLWEEVRDFWQARDMVRHTSHFLN